jgi:hypothetical protein
MRSRLSPPHSSAQWLSYTFSPCIFKVLPRVLGCTTARGRGAPLRTNGTPPVTPPGWAENHPVDPGDSRYQPVHAFVVLETAEVVDVGALVTQKARHTLRSAPAITVRSASLVRAGCSSIQVRAKPGIAHEAGDFQLFSSSNSTAFFSRSRSFQYVASRAFAAPVSSGYRPICSARVRSAVNRSCRRSVSKGCVFLSCWARQSSSPTSPPRECVTRWTTAFAGRCCTTSKAFWTGLTVSEQNWPAKSMVYLVWLTNFFSTSLSRLGRISLVATMPGWRNW